MIRRLVLVIGLVLTVARGEEKNSSLSILREALASPAAPGAVGAALTTAPDGTIWLSWVEPGAPMSAAASTSEHHHATEHAAPADTPPNTLRFSTFDTATKKWRTARTIARAASVTTSASDFPQLAVGADGHVVALWTDGHGGAFTSTSADRGASWSAPTPIIRESTEVEKFSLTVLADNRVLVAWLDARVKKNGAAITALYTRVLGEAGPDVLVDSMVCDCCQTTLTAFLDGGALLAYRGRTEQEVRDIRTARFRGKAWDAPRPLNNDDWRIAGCPVNGPRLAADGGRVAAAWFTAADNEPRVLASYSPDAGARFLLPLRIDRGHPAGHVDTLMLRDGAMLITWIENDGSVWLRRVSPDFTAGEPFALAKAGEVATKNVPRAALVRNYAGGKTAVQFIAAFATDGPTGALRTQLVTVPEGELVDAEKNCDCSPTSEQLSGYSIRGTVATVVADRGAVRVQHDEFPGMLVAGTHEFRSAPEVLAAVAAGRQFLGRIERRDNAWWLFDVKLIVASSEKK